MRKCLLAGACAVAITGNSFAQFASDRLAVPPGSPNPVKPAGGGDAAGGPAAAPRLLPNGFTLDPVRKEPTRPVPTTIDEKAPPPKWAVRPEDGGWMIMVKSYAGADSRQKAEALAADIRTTHRTNALLFERNAEERKEEQAQVEAVRKREQGKAKEMQQVIDQAKREAEANGSTFVPTPLTVKVPRPYHETPEQWVVFIGGFRTMDDAHTALKTVKKLPEPKDTTLMDAGMIGGRVTDPRTGREEFKSAANFLNPYPSAMVVPNPTATKANLEEKAKLEPFVVKLNDGVQHSLLGVKKPWTLLVKQYAMPAQRAGTGGDAKSVFDGKKKGATALDRIKAMEVEAEAMVAALRDKNMKPRPYEAFVLHHTHGSVVTVGQFDDPEDPQLLKLQQELLDLTFEMRDKDKKAVTGPDGRPLVQRLFDGVNLFPVPKY
jgi:hypothetical protein